jgi:hypothetical protein
MPNDTTTRGGAVGRVGAAALVATGLAVAGALDAPSTAFLDRFDVYFGNLHAHTTLSDGSGTPADAFAHARHAGLDFMAVTEHNHREAEHPKEDPAFGAGIASDHSLYVRLTDAARDADRDDRFVALFGQEFSTISSGNHVNVIGASKVIDEEDVPSGDFRTFYESWLPGDAGVRFIQFNHPWDNAEHRGRNYGLAKYRNSHRQMRDASAPWLRTIEVINGPGTRNATGLPAVVKGEAAYVELLTRGFRLAPVADQDNHHRTWGTLTDARTGVLATRLTRRGILDGIDQRRAYASTDRNLRVWFGIDGVVMGSDAAADGPDLQVVWKIQDDDEPDAHYRVSLISGSPSVPLEKDTQTLAQSEGDGTGSANWHTARTAAWGYLRVVQWPGDANEKDTVITSPVWVTVGR